MKNRYVIPIIVGVVVIGVGVSMMSKERQRIPSIHWNPTVVKAMEYVRKHTLLS